MSSNITARLSRGRRATSVCELHVTDGSAAEFVRWVVHGHLLRGPHPLHDGGPPRSLPHPGPARREAGGDRAHGGSPLPTRLLVDHDDTSALVAPPGIDARAARAALSGKRVPIGGVRHEFRDVPRDFRARLYVEFPKTTLPRSLSVHRRHLAAGFSNGKDTAYPVHIDPSVGLGVSERTKLFSDGGKFWMSDGDKDVGRCGTADGCSCGSGCGCVDRMYFEFAPTDLAGAENHVRAGYAACWYSRGMPPRRSCLRTSRGTSRSDSSGCGSGSRGAVPRRRRCGTRGQTQPRDPDEQPHQLPLPARPHRGQDLPGRGRQG
jgi:hypothetical protein